MSPQPVDDWREHAECKGHPVDWWFPKRGERIDQRALAMCQVCPVRRDCTQHARSVPELFGVWGGVDAAARKVSRGRVQRERVTVSDRIVTLLDETGRRMTARQVAERTGVKYDTVGTALGRLKKRGVVAYDPEWHCWWLDKQAVS